MTYTTQAQVRTAFWQAHPEVSRKRLPPFNVASCRRVQGGYVTDTRCAFVDYVDMLARSGEISEALAERVTL